MSQIPKYIDPAQFRDPDIQRMVQNSNAARNVLLNDLARRQFLQEQHPLTWRVHYHGLSYDVVRAIGFGALCIGFPIGLWFMATGQG